jgi:ribonuclease HI
MKGKQYPVEIHTDGSCIQNAAHLGPGGWAAIIVYRPESGTVEKLLEGGAAATTNSQMEITAVLEGLRALTKPCSVQVFTDSQNVIGWLNLGWRRGNAGCKALLDQIDHLIKNSGHTVQFVKIRAHSGESSYNDRCDKVARQIARQGGLKKIA